MKFKGTLISEDMKEELRQEPVGGSVVIGRELIGYVGQTVSGYDHKEEVIEMKIKNLNFLFSKWSLV